MVEFLSCLAAGTAVTLIDPLYLLTGDCSEQAARFAPVLVIDNAGGQQRVHLRLTTCESNTHKVAIPRGSVFGLLATQHLAGCKSPDEACHLSRFFSSPGVTYNTLLALGHDVRVGNKSALALRAVASAVQELLEKEGGWRVEADVEAWKEVSRLPPRIHPMPREMRESILNVLVEKGADVCIQNAKVRA